jgi:adenine-specific DNA-methyltransferase
VLCRAFRGKADKFPNLTVKKFPKQVLSRGEWGTTTTASKSKICPKPSLSLDRWS